MTGSTISTTVTHSVYVGYNYGSPLTITGSGTIAPTANGSDFDGVCVGSGVKNAVIVNYGFITGLTFYHPSGFYAVGLYGAANLTNSGFIEGGPGLYNDGSGSNGGGGIYAFGADQISNTGLIYGGSGHDGRDIGGNGGAGVVMAGAGATLANTDTGFLRGILGGTGGTGGYSGNGGIGVDLTNGAVVNNADIDGGSSGYQNGNATGAYAHGGAGIYMRGGTLMNGSKGYIGGGTGGKGEGAAICGGYGGIGLGVYGGTASNLGTIIGGAGGAVFDGIIDRRGGVGGIGLVLNGTNGSAMSVSNIGIIIGGAGGYSQYLGGAGGAGADVSFRASFNNAGLIIGGAGASAGSKGEYGGAGAYGAVVESKGSFSNSGSVTGGAGGTGVTGYVSGRNGDGVYIENGNVTNSGTITGGTGPSQLYLGSTGGAGVVIHSGTLTNSRLVAGGAGGYGAEQNRNPGNGGNGGIGVVIGQGTSTSVLINAGTIGGGAGGGGDFYGVAGDAVSFAGAGTLVVENGAVFIGDVVANTSFSDVLELAGTSTTDLTGIGTEFTNFNQISFATGAAWTIAGNTVGLDGAEMSGFAAGDTIVVDGFAESGVEFSGTAVDLYATGTMADIALGTSISGDLVISTDGTNSTLSVKSSISDNTITALQTDFIVQHGTASKISVLSEGYVVAEFGGKITSTTIETSGGAEAISGGVMYDIVIDNKAELLVLNGGSATSTRIKKGGDEHVYDGGVSSNTTIDGGTLELTDSGGVAGKLKFKGKGGMLIVDQTEIPTTVISGFKAGDKVELLDAAAGSGTMKVAKAGVVTISAGGSTYKLNIAGAKVGTTNFKFSGFALTETANKMAIQRPAQTADGAAAAHAVPDLLAIGSYNAMTASPAPHSPWCASAAVYAGPVHELIRVPHGGMETLVTLQAG